MSRDWLELIEFVEETKPKKLVIYAGKVDPSDVESVTPFMHLDSDKTSLVPQLRKIQESNRYGWYTFLVCRTNQIKSAQLRQFYHSNPSVNIEHQNDSDSPIQFHPTSQMSKSDEQIRQEIRLEFEAKEKELKLKSLQRELDQSKEPVNKFADAAVRVIEMLDKRYTKPQPKKQTAMLQGNQSEDELSDAYIKLTNKLGGDLLVKLANKLETVEDNDIVLQTVINYANS